MGELAALRMALWRRDEVAQVQTPMLRAPPEDEEPDMPPSPIRRYFTCRRCWTGEYATEGERDKHEAQCAEGRKPRVAMTAEQKERARGMIRAGTEATEIASLLGIDVRAVNGLKGGADMRAEVPAEALRHENGAAHQDERVRVEGHDGDPGQTHYIGDDCAPNGHRTSPTPLTGSLVGLRPPTAPPIALSDVRLDGRVRGGAAAASVLQTLLAQLKPDAEYRLFVEASEVTA